MDMGPARDGDVRGHKGTVRAQCHKQSEGREQAVESEDSHGISQLITTENR